MKRKRIECWNQGEVIEADYNPLKHMATTHATCINGKTLCNLPQVHLCFINRKYFLNIMLNSRSSLDDSFLGYYTVQDHTFVTTLQRNILPLPSRWQNHVQPIAQLKISGRCVDYTDNLQELWPMRATKREEGLGNVPSQGKPRSSSSHFTSAST